MTQRRIITLLALILLALTMAGCKDKEIKSGIWAGYCWDSWAGEHYWCRD